MTNPTEDSEGEELYAPPSPYQPPEEDEDLQVDDIDEQELIDLADLADSPVCAPIKKKPPVKTFAKTGLALPMEVPWGSVWEDPRVVKHTNKVNFKKYWQCGYCHTDFPQWNATKAKAHLARVPNAGIKPCRGSIPLKFCTIYGLQWREVVEKRKRLADPTEDLLSVARMRDGVTTMVSRGTSLLASKLNKRRPPSSANKMCNKPFAGVACIPPAFRLSDLSDDTDFVTIVVDDGDKKPAAKPPRSQIQTLLTNNGPTNAAKATLDMNYLVTAFILEEGLRFSIVGSKNLSRIIAMAKLLPTKYNLPNRQKISGDLMDILYEQRVKNNEVQLQLKLPSMAWACIVMVLL